MAARIPAQPAPTTSTSCVASTLWKLPKAPPKPCRKPRPARADGSVPRVTSRADRFRLVQGLHGGELAEGIFVAEVHDRGLTHARRDGWPTMQKDWAALGEPLFVEAAESHASGVWELNGSVLQLTIGGSWLHVQAAAA